MSESVNNKRIAKNTLLLYLRMFITVAVGLYTSRVVLQTLGVSDYGLYNVVGGIITMVSFLNAAMVSASQRFLSFELGRGDKNQLSRVFCTSVNIHATICLVAFVIAETIGVWFVNTKLNIPEERMTAANWVYQASIVTFFLNVMSVPYNSAIVAHEKMSAFAYISIVDVILKLSIVYLLLIFPLDKLIIYSVLMMIVVMIITSIYVMYCKRHFEECVYRPLFDKNLSCEMFSFAGWSILGNLGFSFKDQVSNIILNLFLGTTINAARGIGIHVATIINTFATNFTMAINPQITKLHASGNIDESRNLVYIGSRFTFYLLALVTIPVIININYILGLWLDIVPQYTSQFVVLSLITSLIYSLSGCITTAIQATGKIKWFQIGISIILLSELPIAWGLLKLGLPPYTVMWPTIVTYIIATFFRFWLIQRYVDGYKLSEYVKTVLIPCISIFLMSYAVSVWISHRLVVSFINVIISSVFCVLITACFIFLLGMNNKERTFVIIKMKTVLCKSRT